MYAKLNISSRNYNNHNERDLITAGAENHVEGIEFLLRLNPTNKYRFEAFEAAMKAQNWASVAIFVKNGVLHGPQNFSKTMSGLFKTSDFENLEYLEQIINYIVDSTSKTEMTSEKLEGFKKLLFELAKLDTSLKNAYASRGTERIHTMSKFRADLAQNYRYFHLFGAVGFAFAKPILSEEIAIHLIKFHFMSTVHGINSHADGLVVQVPKGTRIKEGVQEYLQAFLDAVSVNKDGCRDLFYEVIFRLAYGVSGPNLNDSVKAELYSRKKFVDRIFREQDCKVFTFEIVGDDNGEKKKPNHIQYMPPAAQSPGFERI